MRRWSGLERRRMGGFVPAAANFGTFAEVPNTWNAGTSSSYHADTSHTSIGAGDVAAPGDLLVACFGWASLQPEVVFQPDPAGLLWNQIASSAPHATIDGQTVYSGQIILWRVAVGDTERDLEGDWTPGAGSGYFITIFRPTLPNVQLAAFLSTGAADNTTPLLGSLGAGAASHQLTIALAVDTGSGSPVWEPKLTGDPVGWTGFQDGFRDDPLVNNNSGSMMAWYRMTTGAAQSVSVGETVYAGPTTPPLARPHGVLMAGFTCEG